MDRNSNVVIVAESADAFEQLLSEAIKRALPATGSAQPVIQLHTKEEVCEEFGISLTTLTEWMKDGIVPFLRYGRRVYFERHSLLEAGRSHVKYQRRN